MLHCWILKTSRTYCPFYYYSPPQTSSLSFLSPTPRAGYSSISSGYNDAKKSPFLRKSHAVTEIMFLGLESMWCNFNPRISHFSVDQWKRCFSIHACIYIYIFVIVYYYKFRCCSIHACIFILMYFSLYIPRITSRKVPQTDLPLVSRAWLPLHDHQRIYSNNVV